MVHSNAGRLKLSFTKNEKMHICAFHSQISQECAFSAMIKWVKRDRKNRQNHFENLFLSVDLSAMGNEFIESQVLSEVRQDMRENTYFLWHFINVFSFAM